ncbi:MAG: hypothetical protein RL680_1002 [Actinomycetota bacterium]|jgi:hypothetical protein
MAAGDTGISICADALILLGASPISSFNDGTDESNACDRLYPDVRDSTLVMYPWSFATKKIQLARLIDAPNSVWSYAYALPGDRLSNPSAAYQSSAVSSSVQKNWEVQGDQLLTDMDAVFIDYKYSCPEYLMPQYFVQLLKYMMAWHLAEPITEQMDKGLNWRRVAIGEPGENGRGGYFRTAAQIDGQGNPSRAINDFTLVESRFS